MSATAEDLKLMFSEAESRGDRATAEAVMERLESFQEATEAQQMQAPSKYPEMEKRPRDVMMKSPEFRGHGEAFGIGAQERLAGLQQMGVEMRESAGLEKAGASQQFTKETDARLKGLNAEFQKKYGDSFMNSLSKFMGKDAALLLAPTNAPTWLGRLGQLAGYGAAEGGIGYIPEESDETRVGAATKQAVLSAGLGQFFEVVPGLKNMVKRWLGTGIDDDFAKQGVKLSEKTGVDFKLSQFTGEAKTEAMEKLARSKASGEMAARGLESEQATQLKSYFKKVMNKLKPDSARFGDSVKDSFEKLMGSSSSKKGLLGQRARQADMDFTKAYAASNGTKDIPIANYTQAIDELIDGVADAAKRNPRSAAARKYRNLLSLRKGAAKGNMDAKEIHGELRNLGKAMKGKQRLFSDSMDVTQDAAEARKLYSAIKSDAEAAPALKEAMSNYSKASNEIESIRESVIGKLFNRKGVLEVPEGVSLTPEMIESAFTKMDSSQIRHSMKALSKVDPLIKKRLQAHFIADKIKSASKWAEADIPKFKPAEMLDLINTKKQTFFSVFDDPSAAKDVLDGLEAAQRIMMVNSRTAGDKQLAIKAAGVLASLDKTFIARLAAELATPSAIKSLILDKDAMLALKAISKPGIKQKSALIAAEKLNNWMNEGEPQDNSEQK